MLNNRCACFFLVIMSLVTLYSKRSLGETKGCDAAIVNRAAGCLSAKGEFLRGTFKAGVAATTSIAAKSGVKGMRRNYASYLKTNFDNILFEAAREGQVDWAIGWDKSAKGDRAADGKKDMEQIKSLEKKGVKIYGYSDYPGGSNNARYHPRPKYDEVNKRWVDIANIQDLDISKLPANFHRDNLSSSRVVMESMIDQLKKGKALDKAWENSTADKVHQGWLRDNAWAKDDPIMGKSFSGMEDIAKTHPDPKTRAQAKALVKLDRDRIKSTARGLQSIVKKTGASSVTKLAMTKVLSKKAGVKIGLMALGPIFAAASVAIELSGDTPINSDVCFNENTPGVKINGADGLRVRDVINVSYGRGCSDKSKSTEHAIDFRVENFLMSSDSAKSLAMKNKEVCVFYKELSKKICPQYSLAGSRCTSDKNVSKATLNNGFGEIRTVTLVRKNDRISQVKDLKNQVGYLLDKKGNATPFVVPKRTILKRDKLWITASRMHMGSLKKEWMNFESGLGYGASSLMPRLDKISSRCAEGSRPTNERPSASEENSER